jgi:hypothetical protein
MTTSFVNPYFIDGFDNNIKKQNNNIIYNKESMATGNNNYDNANRSHFKADKLALAEAEMYYDILNTINPGHFNSETIYECSKEISDYYKPSEPFDNTAYITDMIVDDRIRQNHNDWVSEVTPWAGTATIIGATEFSAGDYLNFQGLRRPRGVKQEDPWQITEIDEEQLADNKPFVL